MNTIQTTLPPSAVFALEKAYERAQQHGDARTLIVPATRVLDPVDPVAVAYTTGNEVYARRVQDASDALRQVYSSDEHKQVIVVDGPVFEHAKERAEWARDDLRSWESNEESAKYDASLIDRFLDVVENGTVTR